MGMWWRHPPLTSICQPEWSTCHRHFASQFKSIYFSLRYTNLSSQRDRPRGSGGEIRPFLWPWLQRILSGRAHIWKCHPGRTAGQRGEMSLMVMVELFYFLLLYEFDLFNFNKNHFDVLSETRLYWCSCQHHRWTQQGTNIKFQMWPTQVWQ